MKRSLMLEQIEELLTPPVSIDDDEPCVTVEQLRYNKELADIILTRLEDMGMQPPPVKARIIRGENYKFGSGCTMRCVCDQCDPNFLMNKWEKE